jgi:hypothetical protein
MPQRSRRRPRPRDWRDEETSENLPGLIPLNPDDPDLPKELADQVRRTLAQFETAQEAGKAEQERRASGSLSRSSPQRVVIADPVPLPVRVVAPQKTLRPEPEPQPGRSRRRYQVTRAISALRALYPLHEGKVARDAVVEHERGKVNEHLGPENQNLGLRECSWGVVKRAIDELGRRDD